MTQVQEPHAIKLTIANGAALSEAFDMTPFLIGHVVVPAAWTAANIGFKVSPTEGGTYTIVKDKDGSPLQIASITTDASMTYALPLELAGALWVKLWSKSATAATVTDVNQGAERIFTVSLK